MVNLISYSPPTLDPFSTSWLTLPPILPPPLDPFHTKVNQSLSKLECTALLTQENHVNIEETEIKLGYPIVEHVQREIRFYCINIY